MKCVAHASACRVYTRANALLLALTGPLAAQPSLKITSPADSTTVHPGESLTVTVDVSPPGVFEIVAVNAPTPLGKGKQVLKTPPYQFTIQIPSGTRPNKYAVTAVGVLPPWSSYIRTRSRY